MSLSSSPITGCAPPTQEPPDEQGRGKPSILVASDARPKSANHLNYLGKRGNPMSHLHTSHQLGTKFHKNCPI